MSGWNGSLFRIIWIYSFTVKHTDKLYLLLYGVSSEFWHKLSRVYFPFPSLSLPVSYLSSLSSPYLPLSSSFITALAFWWANPCEEDMSPSCLSDQSDFELCQSRWDSCLDPPYLPFSLSLCGSGSWSCCLTHASWIHSHAKAQKSRDSLRHRTSCSILNHNQLGLKIYFLLLWNAED